MDKMGKFLKPGLKVADQLGIPTGSLGLLSHIGVIEIVGIGFAICLIAIFLIAAFSIGMQCMNSNGDYKAKHSSSYKFMVFTLILALLLLGLGIAIIVARIVAKVYLPMI
jgi:hypothetical protein